MFDFTTPKRVSPKRVSFKNTENKIVNANCHLLCKKLAEPRKFDAFKPEVFTQDGLVLAFLSSFFFLFGFICPILWQGKIINRVVIISLRDRIKKPLKSKPSREDKSLIRPVKSYRT